MKGTVTKSKRSTVGRGLFYTRDSGGRHETTPGEYVRWAKGEAAKLGVSFNGIPDEIDALIRQGLSHQGDLFIDFGVSGNKLQRLGLDTMIQTALTDFSVSHVFIPRRGRSHGPTIPRMRSSWRTCSGSPGSHWSTWTVSSRPKSGAAAAMSVR